ncbi:MAG TPA: alpha-glucan family phosphorylase [Solirubrobacteraceae bacterium]|nr:alpha-glucan family phosphorylase [Solirubrobacteraceae bacterium]
MPLADQGRDDVARAAEELAERLPRSLEPLARLAFNYRWSWLEGAPELFEAIDPARFDACAGNPVRLLQETSLRSLARAAADDRLVDRARALHAEVAADLDRSADTTVISESRPVAFFCAEYGVHASLPVYSGGLGALAGDLLKEASDRALPMVAVGLMYGKGYFRQRVDASGWQHEYWVSTDPERLPAALVTDGSGDPATIDVPLAEGVVVTARIWRVDVGRVPLFLLDTDFAANAPLERWITARLYDGDADTRLAQYVLLGIGGARALHALGIDPGVLHLNEGHAALAPLQLGAGDGGIASARERVVFTTHTPVPAGNDAYPSERVRTALAGVVAELGLDHEELIALGRTHPENEEEEFGMTQAALRLSRSANGVSARHGGVSRTMWTELWPGHAAEAIPIGHVTNGVHVPTWMGPEMRDLLGTAHVDGWLAETEEWGGVDQLDDGELWAARGRQRRRLIEFIRERSTLDRLARSDVREYVQAAAQVFDPDVLTIGFARRVATYKRLDLLTRDPERTQTLLDGDRPVQVVLAGKAHPRDDDAKHVLQRLFGLKRARIVGQRVVFLDDYDLAVAAQLVRGCDLWLNLPRPPLEASGTSGMKSALNGGLQLSVLDGWWAEAYDGTNGWALPGDVEPDSEAQDDRDAATFHALMVDEVVPAFYDRDSRGLPDRWLAMMKSSLRTLGPRYSATRMLHDYVRGPYAATSAVSR